MDPIDIPKLAETRYLVTQLVIRGGRILVVLLAMWLFIRMMKAVSRRIVERSQDDDPTRQSEREKRAETLAHALNAISKVFAFTIGLIMILRELGMNIAPLLTGAGIAGVALGLGAQSLVRDFVNGFYILMENQFRVGDVIQVDGHAGMVEKISLRTTILRDLEGIVHIIPNSEIRTVKNMTHGWSGMVLDVAVGYGEDLGRVTTVLEKVTADFKHDATHGQWLLETPRILGVESLADSGVVVRVVIKTFPLKQWDTARELRRRIKDRLQAEGIEIPFPHRVVINRYENVEETGGPAGGEGNSA